MNKSTNKIRKLFRIALPTIILGIASLSHAVWSPDNTVSIVTVTATSGINSVTVNWVFPNGTNIYDDPPYTWTLPAPVDLYDGAVLLGRIDSMNLLYRDRPAVGLNFAVKAADKEVEFKIASALVPIIPMDNPQGSASAAITITDNNQNGAVLVGLFDGKSYRARYNALSTTWVSLIDDITASPRQSKTSKGNTILNPPAPLPPYINSIDSVFNFKLSPLDSAAGTSYYQAVPEPSVIGLLGLGLIPLLRRRK